MKPLFHYLARGVIFLDGKFLLVHQFGSDNTFLPGGHIGQGEKADVALIREIHEEMGLKATVKRFIGAVEHAWPENTLENHEINLVFEVEIPDLKSDVVPKSLEDHLEFIWSESIDLQKHNLQPYPLVQCLTRWNDNHEGYWGTSL
jgi:8-oxo-dGTP pyrophosphatase MutT (NUDIX family)